MITVDHDTNKWDLAIVDSATIDKSNSTALTVTGLRNGYHYSMNGITRRLAAAILLLHILLALIHTVLVVSYGWKSPALNSLSDAFFLPNNTPPSETTELTAGKQHNSTVDVRKVSDDRLAFVLDDGGKGKRFGIAGIGI